MPPKFGSPVFPSVNGNKLSALAIMNKWKNGHHFTSMHHMEKFQITDAPKSLGLNRNGISVLATMKNSKNGCHSIKMHHTEKFQITDPNPDPPLPLTKVWVASFPSVDRNRKNPKMVLGSVSTF